MNKSIIDNDIRFEILISTMNKSSLFFLDAMFPHHILESLQILIINQTVNGKELISNNANIRVINSYKTGLSNSRNLAVKNAKGEICLLTDDDVEFLPNFETIVLSSFAKLNYASVMQFKIDTFCGKSYKKYPKTSKRLLTNKDIQRASSIEIAFKRRDIQESNIKFNTLFGLGSYFTSGEEYLFLKDILRVGLHVYFESKAIVRHTFESSSKNIAHNNYIKTKAVLYYIDYNFIGYFVLLKFMFFLVRKKWIPLNKFTSKFITGITAIKTYKNLKS